MEQYTIFDDFLSYIEENNELIQFLDEQDSLVNDYVSPIIRTLSYIKRQKDELEEDLSEEDDIIFSHGLECLFENVEQIKLYLKQLNGDYALLDRLSYYIRMVFQLEELKFELQKMDQAHVSHDLSQIEVLLDYFETLISPDSFVNEQVLSEKLSQFDALFEKYDEVVMVVDVFESYCATSGI